MSAARAAISMIREPNECSLTTESPIRSAQMYHRLVMGFHVVIPESITSNCLICQSDCSLAIGLWHFAIMDYIMRCTPYAASV
jgi:hypothetical protein